MPLLDLAPRSFDEYITGGGGRGLEAALGASPDAVIEQVAESGLRGRGGAGFPTAEKWRSIRTVGTGARFAVCNGAEGEPATFKDRALLEVGPGRTLSTLAKAQRPPVHTALNSMRHPQEAASDLAYALQTLGRLWIAGATIEQTPQLIEVWFAADAGASRVPVSLQVFHGQSRLQPDAISWSLVDTTDAVAAAIRPGGRITVRIHCGVIQASDGRMFSAALDAVTGAATLKSAGGVHETWFFVAP